jgi:hypothetical protein
MIDATDTRYPPGNTSAAKNSPQSIENKHLCRATPTLTVKE